MNLSFGNAITAVSYEDCLKGGEKVKNRVEFKMQMATDDTLELYIYNYVSKYSDKYDENGNEMLSETSLAYMRDKLAENPNCTKINMYINSGGGSVIEGIGIYNILKRHTAYKTVYIDGLAGSIASVIAMCADKLIMPTNARLFIHNASCGLYGNASDMRKCADDLDNASNQAKAVYLEKSNGKIDFEKLTELMDAETSLTAEQCLEYGFCDEIATFEKKEPPANVKEQEQKEDELELKKKELEEKQAKIVENFKSKFKF